MATRIPDINLIQDTPTSPNHAPHPVYTSPDSLPRIPEDGLAAPELDRGAEGLQVDPDGAYPQPTTTAINTKSKHWYSPPLGEKQLSCDDSGLILYEDSVQRERNRICGLRRRTFYIIAAVVAIVVVATAVGGGVGGYYAHHSSSSPASPTPTIDYNHPVTSGNVGMAALPCEPATISSPGAPQATPRDISNPYLAKGATFDITCRRGVPVTGDPDKNSVSNVARFTAYNFTTCMNHCAENEACMGVVYGANLTEMVADGDPGANCLLKNATWEPVERRETWMASALKHA